MGWLPGSGCVLWVQMDERERNTTYDLSGYGNHGKIYGASWARGKIGYCLKFDGVDDYVDCGNDVSLQMANNFTVELLIKANIIQGEFYDPISKGHTATEGWVFQGYGAVMYVHMMPAGTANFTIDLRDEKWHHLVAVKTNISGQGLTLYLDGKKDAQNPGATGDIAGATIWNLSIGRDTQNFRNFAGLIDEVRIYDRALTADEIKAHYWYGIVPKLRPQPAGVR